MPDPTIIAGSNPDDPLTLDEVVAFARLKEAAIARLRSENAGLFERIEKLEQRVAELSETRDTLLDATIPMVDWFDENLPLFLDLEDRVPLLKGT